MYTIIITIQAQVAVAQQPTARKQLKVAAAVAAAVVAAAAAVVGKQLMVGQASQLTSTRSTWCCI
jgi:hypothetical protein